MKIKTRSGAMVDVRVRDNVWDFMFPREIRTVVQITNNTLIYDNGDFTEGAHLCTLHSRPTFQCGDKVVDRHLSGDGVILELLDNGNALIHCNIDNDDFEVKKGNYNHADPDLREQEE